MELELSGNPHLTGPIPGAFWDNLPSGLNVLNLNGNSLTGQIQHTVGQLSSIKTLWLSGNMLTGAIPDSIGNLTTLRVL